MRINVYLPDDLAEAYAEVKDRINVSSICQDALRREIQIMNLTHSDAAVARLKRSRAEHVTDRINEGREAGAEWAAQVAEWPHLAELAELSRQAVNLVGVRDWAIVRYDSVGRDHEVAVLDTKEPWDSGFVAGALEAFAQLREAVEAD